MTFRNASADLFPFFYIIYFQKILMHFKIKLLRKLSLLGLTCITGQQWNHEVTIRNFPKILIKEIKDIRQKKLFFFERALFWNASSELSKNWVGVMEWQWEISTEYYFKVRHHHKVTFLEELYCEILHLKRCSYKSKPCVFSFIVPQLL